MDDISTALKKTHCIHHVNVISSSKINTKVTQVLTALRGGTVGLEGNVGGAVQTDQEVTKPIDLTPLVMLTAKSPVASKLITIVEIVKRQLGSDGGGAKKFKQPIAYQYTALHGISENKASKKEPHADSHQPSNGSDESNADFDSAQSRPSRGMTSAAQGRETPVMTVYMSKEPIKLLSQSYGEQVVKV